MTSIDTDPVLPFRVSQLLFSRLCHDLISPAAAVSNGLELLDDGQGRIDPDVTGLLNVSAGQAAGRLGFFRTAYGLGGENVDRLTISEAAQLIDGILETGKMTLDMPASPATPGQELVKILLNTGLLASEMLAVRARSPSAKKLSVVQIREIICETVPFASLYQMRIACQCASSEKRRKFSGLGFWCRRNGVAPRRNCR